MNEKRWLVMKKVVMLNGCYHIWGHFLINLFDVMSWTMNKYMYMIEIIDIIEVRGALVIKIIDTASPSDRDNLNSNASF